MAVAHESDQGLFAIACKFNGEARRRSNRCENSAAGGKRFLNQLKAASATHKNDAIRKRHAIFEQTMTYEFIERVMTADVLEQRFKFSVGPHYRRSVQSAGLNEIRLVA